MTAALAACAACLAAMPAVEAWAAWGALRFAFGAAEGLMFVATETWVNQAAGDSVRGRWVSAYTTALASGFALGPLLIRATGAEGALPFLAAAAATLAGIAALGLARGTAPRIGGALSFGFFGYLAALPVAVAAAALFGFADGGLLAMLTVWGLGLGFAAEDAVALVTALAAGGIALMLPFGWLADRVDRRRLVAASAAASALAIALLPLLAGAPWAVFAALFALGGLLGSLWLVAMALMGERFRGADLAAANVGLTFAYGAGSIAGPVVSGAALEAWPPHGMMPAVAACVAAFALWTAAAGRRSNRPVRRVKRADRAKAGEFRGAARPGNRVAAASTRLGVAVLAADCGRLSICYILTRLGKPASLAADCGRLSIYYIRGRRRGWRLRAADCGRLSICYIFPRGHSRPAPAADCGRLSICYIRAV